MFPFVVEEGRYQYQYAGGQGLMQLAALAVTLAIAIVGGTITGFLLKGYLLFFFTSSSFFFKKRYSTLNV